MRDVYVLCEDHGVIICIADDIERCNMEMARFSPGEQASLHIENHTLLEDGD